MENQLIILFSGNEDQIKFTFGSSTQPIHTVIFSVVRTMTAKSLIKHLWI